MKPRQPLYLMNGAKSVRNGNCFWKMRIIDKCQCLSFPGRLFFSGGTLKERLYTNRRYLDLLSKKVVVFDGAMGTNLQKMNLDCGAFWRRKIGWMQ